jgi:hypothetical protein
MKSLAARTLTTLGSGVGLALFLIATSGIGDDRGNGHGLGAAPPRSGPGFNLDNNPGVIGRTASDNKGAPGLNSQNNPGVTGSQFGRSTAEEASGNGGSHRNRESSFTLGRREETAVETASSNLRVSERASEVLSGKPEPNNPFKGSLLDQGLPSDGKGNGHGDVKPTPPGHHYGWEKGKHNPHRMIAASPTPSATVSPTGTPTPSGSVTPTPSGSVTPSPSPTPAA